MELNVYKIDGSETSKTVALNEEIFNIEPNDHVIWLDVKQILANRRQGTHDSLEKSTVPERVVRNRRNCSLGWYN